MLVAHNLSCIRENNPIFSGLGFSLTPGALLILKGANGSGKTSLLKILSGLLPASEGEVLWQGKPISQNPDFLHQLTYIGHKGGIKTECTVAENIRFWAKLSGTEMLEAAALRYFNMEEMADIPCWKLSAGWQRKVALARLLVSPTPLWLLDEPTNYLDDYSIKLVSELIEARVKQDGIVVVASHSLSSPFASHMLAVEDFL